ncbi:MAG: hypothetical protein RMJ67_06390 [Elusimicrobiota bacterium]|nr:hypothetical protein [Endomicrobiia bacterium]MDW8166122.1 hypothetical protein [Elusimicrobiota bacterium]
MKKELKKQKEPFLINPPKMKKALKKVKKALEKGKKGKKGKKT